MVFYLSRQASCLLGISCVRPEGKKILLWQYTLEQDTVFLFVFCIFIDLDLVSVRKNGPKKKLTNIRFRSFCRYRDTDYVQHKKQFS